MEKDHIFQKALSNFTYDVASGGAIRHLVDSGYTVNEIMENLTFKTPMEQIKRTTWEHLIKNGTILLREPGAGQKYEKISYVKETGKYGRSTFRKVVEQSEEIVSVIKMPFSEFIKNISKYNTGKVYISCEFGKYIHSDMQTYEKMLSVLSNREKDYISGLLWEKPMVYYCLDERMLEIMIKLEKAELYEPVCYIMR